MNNCIITSATTLIIGMEVPIIDMFLLVLIILFLAFGTWAFLEIVMMSRTIDKMYRIEKKQFILDRKVFDNEKSTSLADQFLIAISKLTAIMYAIEDHIENNQIQKKA